MSATTGRIERRTISLSASPARLSGTATRAISQPTSCSCSIWRMVASTSCVRVVHIDCTATGAPSPMAVPPTQTRLDLRRGRGPMRSSGRFRSTESGASTTSSVEVVSALRPASATRRCLDREVLLDHRPDLMREHATVHRGDRLELDDVAEERDANEMARRERDALPGHVLPEAGDDPREDLARDEPAQHLRSLFVRRHRAHERDELAPVRALPLLEEELREPLAQPFDARTDERRDESDGVIGETHRLDEEVLLRAEEVHDQRAVNACRCGDAADRGAVVAVAREVRPRGREDPLAAAAFTGTATSAWHYKKVRPERATVGRACAPGSARGIRASRRRTRGT